MTILIGPGSELPKELENLIEGYEKATGRKAKIIKEPEEVLNSKENSLIVMRKEKNIGEDAFEKKVEASLAKGVEFSFKAKRENNGALKLEGDLQGFDDAIIIAMMNAAVRSGELASFLDALVKEYTRRSNCTCPNCKELFTGINKAIEDYRANK